MLKCFLESPLPILCFCCGSEIQDGRHLDPNFHIDCNGVSEWLLFNTNSAILQLPYKWFFSWVPNFRFIRDSCRSAKKRTHVIFTHKYLYFLKYTTSTPHSMTEYCAILWSLPFLKLLKWRFYNIYKKKGGKHPSRKQGIWWQITSKLFYM